MEGELGIHGQIIGVPIIKVNRNSDAFPPQNIGMSIGQRIRESRKAAKLTQEQLAAKTGIKQSTLSELEKGDSASSSHLPAIARALGVDAFWLQSGLGVPRFNGSLSPKEASIIASYRSATPEGRAFIEMACDSAPKEPPAQE